MLARLALPLAALLVPACVPARRDPRIVAAGDPASARGSPVGCYRFNAAYFPVIGRDPVSGTLVSLVTAELALLETPPPPDDIPHQSGAHAVRPIPFRVDSFTYRQWVARSGWARLSADSVWVTWRNGLFGPVFRLAVRGDSLSGTVNHTTDIVGAPEQRGVATAVRIACPGAESPR